MCSSLDPLEPPNAFPDHPPPPTALAMAVLGNDAILTVGTDQAVRYFNLVRPNRSFHVLPSAYATSSAHGAVYRIVEQDSVPVLFESGVPAHLTDPQLSGSTLNGYREYAPSVGSSPEGLPRSSRPYASHRSSVQPTILSHHRFLQRPHLDAITDIQLLLFPIPLLVTADRMGVIKVIL